jgi:uncharacterized protein
MANQFLMDASAWIALLDADDNHHELASRTYPRLLQDYQGVLMTNLLVSEVYASVRRNVGHKVAIEFLDAIHASPRFHIIQSTAELETQAQQLLRQYDDQVFSYTDAVSFALMRERKITDAFTFDHHFDVLGFRRVP